MTCSIKEDGSLHFRDANGVPMPEQFVEAAKKQNRTAIQDLIRKMCDQINGEVEVLGRLHLHTPDPHIRPQFSAPTFDKKRPTPPKLQRLTVFDRIFKSRKQRIEDENSIGTEQYQEAVAEWEKSKAQFDLEVTERRNLVEKRIYSDISAMEQFLEEDLQDISWSRETKVDFDIVDNGKTVLLDVDLPELEDMPTKLATVPARELKLSVKEMSSAKVQRLYSEHVHSIFFRLIGEVFAALPVASTVVASGYSQRRSKMTGQLADEYLISVAVERALWEQIDFFNLRAIDVTQSLTRFALRMDQLKSGVFNAISPHTNPTPSAG